MVSHRRARSVCRAALSRRSSSWPLRSAPTMVLSVVCEEAYLATWSRNLLPPGQLREQLAGPLGGRVPRVEVLDGSTRRFGEALASGGRANGLTSPPPAGPGSPARRRARPICRPCEGLGRHLDIKTGRWIPSGAGWPGQDVRRGRTIRRGRGSLSDGCRMVDNRRPRNSIWRSETRARRWIRGAG